MVILIKFLDIATGYPVSINDAGILRDSALYVQAECNMSLTEATDVIDGYKIRPFLIGDGAYLANNLLLKPFPNNLNLFQKQIQQVFIFSKSSSRACFWDFKDKMEVSSKLS